ncbi:MAG: hypothetical protein JO142_22015 [Burkholderiales bacterium]|nr:hypothetical protein [Burkholderiales bacterium]
MLPEPIQGSVDGRRAGASAVAAQTTKQVVGTHAGFGGDPPKYLELQRIEFQPTGPAGGFRRLEDCVNMVHAEVVPWIGLSAESP